MANLKIAVFAYNFPHKKSQDVLLRLFLENYQVACVLAADPVKLDIPAPSIRTKIKHTGLVHPKVIAEKIGAAYFVVPHNSWQAVNLLKSQEIDLGIIAGARILQEHVIEAARLGIINLHPGLIPEVRGLDALLWSISQEVPLGVTAHLIDKRIDAGTILLKEKIPISENDTILDLSERLYETQLELITPAIEKAKNGEGYVLDRATKYNTKMPAELEKATLAELSQYLQKMTATKKKLKFALIGCGRISKKHVEAIVNNAKCAELVAVCDIVEERAQELAQYYLQNTKYSQIVNIYTNYQEMLQNEDIDIVSIATESGYHYTITLDCLNADCHVIVEKPMALSVKDAVEMVATAAKNNKKLSVCHQNRFNPPIQKLKKEVDKNSFGKLVNITARILWNRNNAYYAQADWRGTYALDGGTLMNQCIHNIDLLAWMAEGEIDTVYAQMDTFLRPIEAEDFGAILLRFKNGTIGLVEGSACVYPENLEETLSLFGEKGTAVIGGLAVNKIQTWRFADGLANEEEIFAMGDKENPASVYGEGHTALFKDMIEAIIDDREPLVTGEAGKKAVEIVLAAYKSQKLGIPIKLPLDNFSTLDMKM